MGKDGECHQMEIMEEGKQQVLFDDSYSVANWQKFCYRKAQKWPHINPRPNFREIYKKKAKKRPNFFDVSFSLQRLDFLQKYTVQSTYLPNFFCYWVSGILKRP
jgi:hypothetical protein